MADEEEEVFFGFVVVVVFVVWLLLWVLFYLLAYYRDLLYVLYRITVPVPPYNIRCGIASRVVCYYCGTLATVVDLNRVIHEFSRQQLLWLVQ